MGLRIMYFFRNLFHLNDTDNTKVTTIEEAKQRVLSKIKMKL